MSGDAKISFVHSGVPDCTSPIVSYHRDYPEYVGIHGTGFFARKLNTVVFITARHCLTRDHQADIADLASRLLIPYERHGTKLTRDDYVEFSDVYSFHHSNPDIPGEYVDLIILRANVIDKSKQHKRLMARAVKLPPSGNWFDEFTRNSLVEEAFLNGGRIPLLVIGYPLDQTATEVTAEKVIQVQRVFTSGYLKPGFYPHTMGINDIVWEHDLNGFSGSPVFIQFRNRKGTPQQVLVGMIVTGGNNQAQFIRISQIALSQFDPPLWQ